MLRCYMTNPNIVIPNITLTLTEFDIYVIVGVCLGFEFMIKPIIKSFKWVTGDVIQSLVMILCVVLVSVSSPPSIVSGILQGIIDGALCNALYDLIVSKFTKKKEDKNEKV